MHNDTAYQLLGNSRVGVHKMVDGKRERIEETLKVIEFANAKASSRHGSLPNGDPRPYKGYKGDSNFCMEIVRNERGQWVGRVISTFDAYQIVRRLGLSALRSRSLSISGEPLVMRLLVNDLVRLEIEGALRTMRITKLSANGQLFMADLHEANVDARNRNQHDAFKYVSKTAGSLLKSKARRVTITPIGEMNDRGFKE